MPRARSGHAPTTVLLALTLSLAAPSVRAVEQPDYTVIDQLGDVEIRTYAPYRVVSMEVEGEFEDAADGAFEALAGYLGGDNATGRKFGFTAPVEQYRVAEGRHRLTFMIPPLAVDEAAPDPTDTRLEVRQVPSRTIAAIRYSGGWAMSRYLKHARALRDALDASTYTPCGHPIWARYNPPFWPAFLKRNEVWAEVVRGTPC